ncbi:MAG: hypothetical protein JWP45_1561 [Mucilaginibacter sp.]|nr:hypothetical protein [Mucilaginibacter sp.]
MKTEKARTIIALMIVGVYMLMSCVAIFYPFLNVKVKIDDYANYFTKTSSVYSGIIGVIIGYYFAKNENRRAGLNNSDSTSTGGPNPNIPTGSQGRDLTITADAVSG